MMNKGTSRITPIALVAAVALSVTGCTDDNDTVEPTVTPTPTISVTATAEPAPIATATADVNHADVDEDIELIITPSDFDIEDSLMTTTEVEQVVTSYAQSQLDPFFMSGAWVNGTSEDFANVFADAFSDELLNEVSSLDVHSPEDSRLVSSLAAVLTPTDDLKAGETCNASVGVFGCLAMDPAITDVKVTESEVNDDTVLISFSLHTARLLDNASVVSLSEVSYANQVWFDKSDGHIVSVQNKFTFGQIQP